MWILPKNHPESYRCVQDTEGSKSALGVYLLLSPSSLMWRSKPSRLRTWWTRWKRDSWFRRLSGRILKLSEVKSFEEALTSSSEAIRASRSQPPESVKVRKIPGTSGLTFLEFLEKSDRERFFSRMSKDILASGSAKSSPIWKKWVTRLRSEYSVRRKSALLTVEKESLSWGTPTSRDWKDGTAESCARVPVNKLLGREIHINWPTPNTMDVLPCRNPTEYAEKNRTRGGRKNRKALSNLREAVHSPVYVSKNWGTPRVTTNGGTPSPQCTGKGSRLEDQVAMPLSWATPNTMDHMNLRSEEALKRQSETTRKGRTRPANLREQVDPESCAVYEKNLWLTPRQMEVDEDYQTYIARMKASGNPKNVGKKNPQNLTMQVKLDGRQDPEKSSTTGKNRERLWMTPKAGNQSSTQSTSNRPMEKSTSLDSQVPFVEKQKSWPTPTTPSGGPMADGSGPVGLSGGLGHRKMMKGVFQPGAKLNPSWVEQLQGLPVGWTALSYQPTENRIDRLRLLGNGVVPQTVEKAFRMLTSELFGLPSGDGGLPSVKP